MGAEFRIAHQKFGLLELRSFTKFGTKKQNFFYLIEKKYFMGGDVCSHVAEEVELHIYCFKVYCRF